MRPGIEAMNVEEQVVIRIGSGITRRGTKQSLSLARRAHAIDLSCLYSLYLSTNTMAFGDLCPKSISKKLRILKKYRHQVDNFQNIHNKSAYFLLIGT